MARDLTDENDIAAKDLTEKIAENIQSVSTKVPHVRIAEFKSSLITIEKEECAFVESNVEMTFLQGQIF